MSRDFLGERHVDFNVRGWLASLTGYSEGEIRQVDESEEPGRVSARYRCSPTLLASVHVSGLPRTSGGSARWQVVAEFGQRVVRVELPGDTRFAWR
jgi:hypothetical protein